MIDASSALLVARLLLAVVFALAGLAKLADIAGSRRAVSDFGVPAALAGPISVILPIAELGVSLALLIQPFALVGALGALALLLIFVGAIARSLAAGRAPDCHCFGKLHSEPAGWPTLIRNGVFAALAAGVAAALSSGPAPDPLAWLGPSPFVRVAGVAGVLAGMWLLVRAKSGHPPTHAATPAGSTDIAAGLAVGTTAPDFSLPNLAGSLVTLGALRATGRPTLLFFSDPTCGPCTALLPEIARWDREYAERVTVVIVSRGSPDAYRTKAGAHAVTHVLLQQDREVATAYGAEATPAAVLIRADGTVGSRLGQAARGVREIFAQAVSDPTFARDTLADPPPALQVSTPAPDFARPDLTGRVIALSDYRDRPVLVLFWSPACGFCQRMLRHLTGWETSKASGSALRLLVVSAGAIEANQACGFRSTVILDDNFSVGRQFGVRGTPTAVLIDADGRIAAEPAVGGPSILAALNFRPGGALPKEARLRRAENVDDELLSDGSMVVYSGANRRAFTLNGTGALVWDGCDGTRTIEAIVAEVREVFPDALDPDGDVRELVDTLLADDLVRLDPDTEPRRAIA